MKKTYLLSAFFLFFSLATSYAQERIIIESSASEFSFWINESAKIQSIDWGDGTISDNSNGENRGNLQWYYEWVDTKRFDHYYTSEQSRTIVIIGYGITHFNGSPSQSQMTSLDISHAKKLKMVWINNLNYTTLDASNLPELEYLNCFGSKLQRLNCSNCPKLEILECSETPLTMLNIEGCHSLHRLHCEKTQLHRLVLYGNNLSTELDNSKNLTVIDATNIPNLHSLWVRNCPSLEEVINLPKSSDIYFEGSNNLVLPNPSGTVAVNVRNTSNGNTLVKPAGCETGFYIKNENFVGESKDWQFIRLDRVKCLSQVDLAKGNYSYYKLPGFNDKVAVTPGYGYNACYWNKKTQCHEIFFIYVKREILSTADTPGVIGAEIEYIGHRANWSNPHGY